MIDFDDMKRRQEDGLTLLESLQEDESMVLRHYCSLATEALMKMSEQRQSPTDQVVINALRYGIALGLRLKITAGEVHGRV
ncbi:MAG: hypothetical protein PHQ43_01515 [Dehalococcoidales bacterium]|nr:hypothetical protein [Dehalococcoidales bacterium]